MADITTLEKLAAQIEKDTVRGSGLNFSTLQSIVDIIRCAIGAPISWPSREAGAQHADEIYLGDNALRAAFNNGVKWAVEHYTPTEIINPRFPSVPARRTMDDR